MEEAWIDAAVAGIDANLNSMVYRGVGNKLDGDVTLADIPGAPTISGTGRPDLKDLFQLPAPHNEPFLKMLAHPAVVSTAAPCLFRVHGAMGREPWRSFSQACTFSTGHGLHHVSHSAGWVFSRSRD